MNLNETLTRRQLLKAGFATILAACAPAAPSADQRATFIPSAPPANPDFKDFNSQIEAMTKGGFVQMLKTPNPIQNGVTADLLRFDYDDKQGIITARWRVYSWKILKDVEIRDIKTENLANIPLTDADRANRISVQGSADLKWIWRQAPLQGRLDDVNNLQRGPWGNYRNGAERFNCQLGKQVSCDLGQYRIFRGSNWPVLGDLFQMVYSDPTSTR